MTGCSPSTPVQGCCSNTDMKRQDRDYDTVAAALLGTLEAALGEDFTPAVRSAWVACYSALAGEMKAAATEADALSAA